MNDYTGQVVEFLSSGTLRIGYVRAQAGHRLRLVDRNGRDLSIAAKTVVVAHGALDEAGFRSRAQALEEEAEALAREIDLELLWESVSEEQRAFSLQELSREYFGGTLSTQQSALFRAILEEAIRFRLKGLSIIPRVADQVSERTQDLEKRRLKREHRQRVTIWVREVIEAGRVELVPAEMEEVLDLLEDFLSGKRASEARELLAAAELDLTPKELAFELLVRTGRLPEDTDPLLIVAGIEQSFSPQVLGSCDQLTPFPGDDHREDFGSLEVFSIDDPETGEIDDALTLEVISETLRVGIHITEAAYFVSPGDLLYEQASRRTTSIYLPTQTVPMFPERLSMDLASLNAGELRPTMSFVVDLDSEGQIRAWKLRSGQVRVTHRLSYDQVDAWLETDTGEGLTAQLRCLDRLTAGLLQQRREKGALTIRRPELKIRVRNGDIQVGVIDTDSPSRRIVSELMILANSLAAQYAFLRNIPLIYRAQDPPYEEVNVPEQYDPVCLDRIFRRLRKSRFSLVPQPHAGLGLSGYTQLTSPLRRFVDLVIQIQLSAHFRGAKLPFDQQELMGILAASQMAEQDAKAVERKANRLYTLQYLAQSGDAPPRPAIVIAALNSGYLVETEDLYVRGRLSCAESLEPGERVMVRIEQIDPQADKLVFAKV